LALPACVRDAVEQRIAELARSEGHPVVCPFLDRDEGACLVYAHRLLACRAYGYYVSRSAGRWCKVIDDELDARGEAVMHGNFDAVMDEARAAGGESITMLEWWRERQ
jgi:Fe-S-cluster containining protein